MSQVYTIKYSKNDGDSRVTVLEGDAELASFSEGDPDFKGIVDSFPAFDKIEPGMEICVTASIEEFNSKYGLELDVNGDSESKDGESNEGDSEEHEENESKEEEEAEHEEGGSEEGEETSEKCEKCNCEPCECKESDEKSEDSPDSDHLAKDAEQLNDIESRIHEIEATLAGLSNVFGKVEQNAEQIDDTVDEMQSEDAAETGQLNTLDFGDEFTDAEVPEFAGSGGDVESTTYSGSRVWGDPSADFTDSSFAVVSESEPEKEEMEEDYDIYGAFEEFTAPKKRIGKFKL